MQARKRGGVAEHSGTEVSDLLQIWMAGISQAFAPGYMSVYVRVRLFTVAPQEIKVE